MTLLGSLLSSDVLADDACSAWTFTCRQVTIGAGLYEIEAEDFGLLAAAEIRRVAAPRPIDHGMVSPGPDFLGEQQIVIPVFIAAADELAAAEAVVRLKADWVPAAQPFEARVTTPLGAFRVTGKPDPLDVPSLATIREGLVHAIARFYVTDPVARGEAVHEATMVLAAEAVPSGWGFPHGFPHGYDPGSADDAIAHVTNAGNVAAPLTVTISATQAPLVNPTIEHIETGQRLGVRFQLPEDLYLILDTAGRNVWLSNDPDDLSGAALRNDLIAYPDDADWLHLPAGTSRLRFLATSGAGVAVARWRDAWLL
jgi:hypothetical protein